MGRTAVEWFQEAARSFVQGHQGCPACGGRHCVFHSDWGERVEYYCSRCDFSACHDLHNGTYYAGTGRAEGRPEAAGPEFDVLEGLSRGE